MAGQTTLAQRIVMAVAALSLQSGRRVSNAEFGARVADAMGRAEPFGASAVTEWTKGRKKPPIDVVRAIAAIVGWNPGWVAYGEESGLPAPPGATAPVGVLQPRPQKKKKGGDAS